MEKKIFRSKSIDRVSSPEQLNDYVRVSNPGVWMVLAAMIVLLVGVCVWGVFGRLDTVVQTAVLVKDGNAVCYVKETEIEKIEIGQTVRVKDGEYEIVSISASPLPLSEHTDAYVMHIGSLSPGEWVYAVTCTAPLPDGVYEGKIVRGSVRPISFLLN